ncbi:MAG: hypothetical protein HYY01_00620 [Chloroflexi bacterium]|nr:hypothetical protein [Chloroflexota bacterium]
MREDSLSFVRQVAGLADEYIRSSSLTVFVMGPDLTANRPSATLRQELISRCNLEGLAVKAEHEGVIAAVKRKLKSGFTLTHLEAFMAKDSDLIVIIPDSPGSIAELGYFALRQDLCPKMVILFEKQYLRQRSSYIAQGPRKAARDFSAEVKFVDYSRPAQVWTRVLLPRIQKAKAAKVLRRLENG